MSQPCDKDKVLKLLDELGIGYKFEDLGAKGYSIKMKEGYPKVGGYNWFYTRWEFDHLGKFETVGAWE